MVLNDTSDYLNANYTLYRAGYVVVTKDRRRADPEREKKPKNTAERKYKMSKIKVRSACIDFWRKKQSKFALFITFTDPFGLDEKIMSRAWELMLNNLRNNYEVKNYVWVKERQKQGRFHYHILIDRCRVNIKRLQQTWATCIGSVTGREHEFFNSVRLGRRPVVRSVEAVKNYLSKYVSKAEKVFSSETGKPKNVLIYYGRCYGFSQGLVLSRKVDFDFVEELAEMYKFVLLCDDPFFRVYLVKDYIDVPEHVPKLFAA